MKYLLPLLALLSFMSGCKKDPATPQPVAATIAGEYKTLATVTYVVDGKTTTESRNGTLSVFQGNTPNTYYFLEKYPAYEQGYSVTLMANTVAVDQFAETIRYDNIEWYAYQNGTGTVGTNRIDLIKTTNGATGVIRASPYDIQVSKPMAKKVTVVATK